MGCTRCPKPWESHRKEPETGLRFCDDGVRAYSEPRLAASQSFTPDEVVVLEELVRAAHWGQPASAVVLRGKAFANVARKVQTMGRRIKRIKESRSKPKDDPGVAHAPGHE